ncbi:hypothetical protein HCMG_00077 [Helicobacter canadensis MIT 98-5491]|nr:hypothetical protein HCMG_00077 [Helicobacter canadensis MIT 98-5491]
MAYFFKKRIRQKSFAKYSSNVCKNFNNNLVKILGKAI